MENTDYTNKVSEVKLIYRTNIKASDSIKITCAADAFRIFCEHWDKDTIEHIEEFKILLLNRANMVLGIASISRGGIAGTVIDTRIIFQYALKANASQIVLAHNHPSGSLKPSDADIAVTKKVHDAGKIFDIRLLDHLIITPEDRYYSLADEGCF
jgi:DNA repair protein RadC